MDIDMDIDIGYRYRISQDMSTYIYMYIYIRRYIYIYICMYQMCLHLVRHGVYILYHAPGGFGCPPRCTSPSPVSVDSPRADDIACDL